MEFLVSSTNEDRDVLVVLRKLIDGVERERQNSTDEYYIPLDSRCINDHSNNVISATDSSADRWRQRCGSKKVRIRDKKYKWKPYHKLTGDQRRRLDERNTRRAEAQRRQMREVYGLTLAPFNTTQYLMEEHERDIIKSSKIKDDYNSSEDFYSSADDDMDFFQKQFTEVYDTYHASYIDNLSNAELIRELIQLEDTIEGLEQGTEIMPVPCLYESDSPEDTKIEVFKNEIEKLTVENHKLELRNQMLQSKVSKLNAN